MEEMHTIAHSPKMKQSLAEQYMEVMHTTVNSAKTKQRIMLEQ